MYVELLWATPDAENVIEFCGRMAYKSQDKVKDGSAEKFIRSIIRSGHESVVEHASACFEISGVSRALTHQLVRHRLASYTQESQRYVSQDHFRFVVPDSIMEDEEALFYYKNAMKDLAGIYATLVDVHNIPKEDARFVLPNACDTSIIMTCNFREWRHFLKLRLDKHAQWEIRQLANIILRILMDIAPTVFEDLECDNECL